MLSTSHTSNLLWRLGTHARDVVSLRSQDRLLISFPKSGSTWVRFILFHYVFGAEDAAGGAGFGDIDATMPEFGVGGVEQSWPHADVLPRFVKSHKRYGPWFRSLDALLIVRDPRDVAVSYFHFDQARIRRQHAGDFSEFLRHPKMGLEAWFRHTQSWLSRARHVIRFEALKADDLAVCRRALEAMHIPIDVDRLQRAVEQSRFERMRKAETQHGHPDGAERFVAGSQFTRSGRVGGWQAMFKEPDLAYLDGLCVRYSAVADRLELR